MVLVIDSGVHSVGATAHTYGNNTYMSDDNVLNVTVGFFLSGKQEPFFSETERAALFRKSATKRCIDDLQKRLEANPR
jgi:hypothetical protein